jgi:hypothetical protein
MTTNKCYKCSILLNEENKVKDRNFCKSCSRQDSKDYKARNRNLISDYNKIYKKENKEEISEYNQKYHEENKQVIQARHTKNNRERMKIDPCFKLAKTCRNRLRSALQNISLRSLKLTDCTMEFLRDWLKSNFTSEMTFENHGSYWHIDHVIPCSLFDLLNDDAIKHCFHWTNLQPLEARENLSKNNKINQVEVINHWNKVKKFATLHNITINNFDYSKYF